MTDFALFNFVVAKNIEQNTNETQRNNKNKGRERNKFKFLQIDYWPNARCMQTGISQIVSKNKCFFFGQTSNINSIKQKKKTPDIFCK